MASPRLAMIALFLGCWTIVPSQAGEPQQGPDKKAVTKRALLVGCTKYELPGVRELWGPLNDIALWRKTLVERFGFPEDQIQVLLGWPDEPSRRPSRSNISQAFERLIEAAQPKDQIVVVLSGHGAQVPVPENNNFRTNPEPDGLDEVFLPADVKTWTHDNVENAIKDDQIGEWLDRFRAKGANVWIVFDSCHSGTMTRGFEGRERSRSLRPADLGVPDSAIEAAAQRAKAAADPGVTAARPKSPDAGSVVAFYAAQPFEESPELPRPEDASQAHEHYFGLFSFALNSTLAQRQSPLTYRELSQLVSSEYRAERKSRPPTPFVEGDLDREVLGFGVWPHRSDILLTKKASTATLSVSAGKLQGVSPGSVLAIHPPPGDARKPDEVLGYVEVAESGVTSATVHPVAFEDTKTVELAAIPNQARCEIVARGTGENRVEYAVLGEEPAKTAIRRAFSGFDEEARSQAVEVSDPAKADWWLKEAEGHVLLLQGRGEDPLALDRKIPGKPFAAGTVVQKYALAPDDQLAAGLERDFQKIFRWQNLWRVTRELKNNSQGGQQPGLRIELKVFGGAGDTTGHPLDDPVLHPGERVAVTLVNDSVHDLWVTLLALDSRFEIKEALPMVSIPARLSTRPESFEITGESFGSEGLIALAFPIEGQRERPRLDFLFQGALGGSDAGASRGIPPQSPFAALMKSAASGSHTRGIRRQIATEPQVASAVWLTVPAVSK